MPLPSFQEIHIETTNACGYRCVMCPRESQTRRIGFMPMQDFSLALDRIGPTSCLFHLHGFGESLLDRDLSRKAEVLKKKSPSARCLIFSTLGVKVAKDYFEKLLGAGLDAIVVSLYGFTREDYKKVHGSDSFELVKENLLLLGKTMKSFPKFSSTIKVPSPGLASSLPVEQPPERIAFYHWAKELGFAFGEWSYVHNFSDGRSYNKPIAEKICPVICGKRKNILNITWDLNVIPCCFDYNASIRLGNLRESSLEEIFSSAAYFQFVVAQKNCDFTHYPICKNCEKSDHA